MLPGKQHGKEEMMYQVDCSVLLDGKKFYEMSIWNMYCRKKSYVMLNVLMYAFSLLMMSSALPQILTGSSNTAIINGGMGFILFVLVVYMNVSHISRFKKAAQNEEWLKKTGKHIRITREQIVNYRIEAQDERKYEWSQVLGAYNRKDEVVLCTKKDEQIMTLDKSKLSESEMKFITDIIDEKHLWRTAMPLRTVWVMFGAVTVVGIMWIVQAVMKVM